MHVVCNVQCQIELPKLVSELDSNQLVTNSLLKDLNNFFKLQHQIIDNYLISYTAKDTFLEDVAKGIPYDIITATVASKKVCSVLTALRYASAAYAELSYGLVSVILCRSDRSSSTRGRWIRGVGYQIVVNDLVL